MTTPEAWLDVLESRLSARQAQMAELNDWYTGNHPLPFVTPAHQAKLRNEFRQLLADSRSNFMELVIDTTRERLRVDGFRLSGSENEDADRESWGIWQANGMDMESGVAFTEALVKGVSYLSVWEGERRGDPPTLAAEDPLQTIVGYESGSGFRRREAALKVWQDEWTGVFRANVYLPDAIVKFEAAGSEIGGATASSSSWSFSWSGASDATAARAKRWRRISSGDVIRNPVGVVPIVPLRNKPRRSVVEGVSEIDSVVRVQAQVNSFVFLLALAMYFGSHRQRWMAGVPLYDESGKPLEVFNVAIDRLWASENPDARFGDFDQTDVSGYLNAIEQQVQHIAVMTRTPRHMLLPQGQEPSGDAIKSAEAGLIAKVRDRQVSFGEGLEEALRLARRFNGSSDTPVDSEIVWKDPQIRSEAEVTDAAIKRFQAGLTPWHQTVEDLGYSATRIALMLEAFGGVPPTPAGDSPEPLAA